MYEFLLIDLDDTVLDFHGAEAVAIRKTLADAGVKPTDAVCQRYSECNQLHWKRLERGEITREQVIVGRFQMLFDELGVAVDAVAVADNYTENLSQRHDYLPGAEEALIALQRKYRLFLASNGTAWVQHRRINASGVGKYFEKMFISQEIGADKPAKEFFERSFAQIPGFDPAKAMMIGDSLTSDILGGQNVGITTCWVNLHGKTCNLEKAPDYEIGSISQLEALLDTI
jgi:2-haloacid dehalogenase